jgi:hypothetical protein
MLTREQPPDSARPLHAESWEDLESLIRERAAKLAQDIAGKCERPLAIALAILVAGCLALSASVWWSLLS